MFLVAFLACKKDPPQEAREKLAIGVLLADPPQIHVLEGEEETVITALGARLTEDSTYSVVTEDSLGQSVTLSCKLSVTDNLDKYLVLLMDGLFSYGPRIVYKNARCGNTHPGFTADCIATFGGHRAFGNSMTWTVKTWKSCANGDTLCVANIATVGQITYHQSNNCSDTTTINRPIIRLRCD